MWLVQLCCEFLGLTRETIKSHGFGKKYLHGCKNFEEKWDCEGAYGCYGKILLFSPIHFYFYVQFLMMKELMGMGLLSKVWKLFIMNELPRSRPIGS
jgi:hypothetical protein